MTNLSPAAQVVLDAYRDESWTPDEEDNGRYYKFSHKAGMAAGLRAAADEVCLRWAELQHPADVLNAIADELEVNGTMP